MFAVDGRNPQRCPPFGCRKPDLGHIMTGQPPLHDVPRPTNSRPYDQDLLTIGFP